MENPSNRSSVDDTRKAIYSKKCAKHASSFGMKNTRRLYRVFFDTSVLLSGLNSPQGASGVILSLFKLKKIVLAISQEVLIEAERVMRVKFPYIATPFLDFLSSKPLVSQKLSAKDIQKAYRLVPSEDAPIFAGALKSRADFLVTLDKNFEKLAQGKSKVKPMSPGVFLQLYRLS